MNFMKSIEYNIFIMKKLICLVLNLLLLTDCAIKSQDILAIPETAEDEKICFALYTVHENILKLTAQFYPFNDNENFRAALEIKEDISWIKIAESDILYPGLIATFRVENWDDKKQYESELNIEIE